MVDIGIVFVSLFSKLRYESCSFQKMLLCLVFHTSVATETMTFTRTDITVDPSEENNVPMDIRSLYVFLK